MQALPTLITGAIIYLAAASVYWTDLGYPNQNSILNGLQFVSKFHEICIIASLTAIVLHRTRYELIEASGVPLGFLTAAYQLGSIIYLVSGEFWGGLTAKSRQKRRTWLPLWLLIVIACLLAPVLGPASAIVTIPSLQWWKFTDPLINNAISVFLPLGSSQLWPTTVSRDLLSSPWVLPETGNCLADVAYEDPVCPSGGFGDIAAWAAGHMSRATEPNITVKDLPSGVSRYLTSNTFNQSHGWAVTSIVGLRQARDAANFWQYLKAIKAPIASVQRPLIRPSLANSLPMKKPVVQAQCKLFKMDDAAHEEVTFPISAIRSPSLHYNKQTPWRVPGTVNMSGPSNGVVDFHWVDMSTYTDEAGFMGAVLVSKTPDGSTGVIPCTIMSHWSPVNIWSDPKIGSAVFQDSAKPLDIVSSLPNASASHGIKNARVETPLEPISVDMAWASALNLRNRFPTLNPAINLTTLETSASNFGFLHGNLSWRLDPAGGDAALPWIFSTLLSMHVADGLARVNSGFATLLYHRGVQTDGQGGTGTVTGAVKNMDNVNIGAWLGMPLDSGRRGELYAAQARTTNSSRNTEMAWKVERLGYGWGFEIGLTVVLGAVILLLHALMALIHTVFLVAGTWGVSTGWKSPAEMVVLGWGSREAGKARLENTSVGIDKVGTWRRKVKVMVRESESKKRDCSEVDEAEGGKGIKTNLELILEGDASREDQLGRPRIKKDIPYG